MNIKKNFLIIAMVVGIGALGAYAYAATSSTPPPIFSFDATKAPEWWNGGNRNTQTDAKTNASTYNEAANGPIKQLPTASIGINHNSPGSNQHDDGCFINYAYYDYQLDDLSSAYKNYEDRKTKWGELKQIDSLEQSIMTHEGTVPYELRQYDYTINTEEDILSGYQIGFAAMANGHLRIEGVCETADDLALTLPVLAAVTLRASE